MGIDPTAVLSVISQQATAIAMLQQQVNELSAENEKLKVEAEANKPDDPASAPKPASANKK